MVNLFEALERFGVNSNTLQNLMNKDWPQYKSLEVDITFAAATTGAVATHDLFTVTGLVEVALIAVCTTTVEGTGDIRVGTSALGTSFIESTTGTDIDKCNIWHDATPDNPVELSSVVVRKLCAKDITYRIVTGTLTSGVIKFILLWNPLSADGKVVVA